MKESEVVLAMLMQAAAPIAAQLTAMDPDGTAEDRLAINTEKAFLAVLNTFGTINERREKKEASCTTQPSSAGSSSARKSPSFRMPR